MITAENPKRLSSQKCPLCGELQDVMINGHEPVKGTSDVLVNKDKGYSFCNCRDIFFTDWLNIRQSEYDVNYFDKYNNESSKNSLRNYALYIPFIQEFKPSGRVLEIGSINPVVLDEFKSRGYETFALDIMDHPRGEHGSITADFENWETDEKFDVIFASHIFEHFKDPIKAVEQCHKLLNTDGALFVAMPDPYFIDWKDPYRWGHWHLLEHHILWNMESFCDVLREKGFEIVISRRNIGVDFICIGDFHIVARKK